MWHGKLVGSPCPHFISYPSVITGRFSYPSVFKGRFIWLGCTWIVALHVDVFSQVAAGFCSHLYSRYLARLYQASRKLFVTRRTKCPAYARFFAGHFSLSPDIFRLRMTCEQSFLRKTFCLAGHFVRRSRSSSPDIFQIRWTCPACPANFGRPAI